MAAACLGERRTGPRLPMGTSSCGSAGAGGAGVLLDDCSGACAGWSILFAFFLFPPAAASAAALILLSARRKPGPIFLKKNISKRVQEGRNGGPGTWEGRGRDARGTSRTGARARAAGLR